MDQNVKGNSTPVTGPHGFGGRAVHQATADGNRKLGNVDYEDTMTDVPEVLCEKDYPITIVDIDSIRGYDEDQIAYWKFMTV